MYRLEVVEPAAEEASTTATAPTSSAVLTTLTALLEKHPECERIVVRRDDRLLFEMVSGGFPIVN